MKAIRLAQPALRNNEPQTLIAVLDVPKAPREQGTKSSEALLSSKLSESP